MSGEEMPGELSLHGTAVAIGDAGVLLRGASGSGKTSLALALMERARVRGRFAALVADDRVRVASRHGRLVASAPAPIAGLVEMRGGGLVRWPYLQRVVLRLIVDIDPAAPRYPEASRRVIMLHGVSMPRLVLRLEQGADVVIQALDGGFLESAMTEW